MKLLAWFRSVALKFFHRSATAGEMEEELRSHIQLRTDDLMLRPGLSPAEAERRARIEFGAYEHYREESHEALGGNLIETLALDVRYTLRVLRKSPGFVVAAVVTLALAIGANALVFGVLNALILRPLAVPAPQNVWAIEHWESYPDYLDLRDRNHTFDGLAAWKMVFTGVDTGNDPVGATGYAITGNYFDVLQLQPALGRFFHASDEHGPNSAPYIVLTSSYWHSRFHDDPGVIGRTVQIAKHPFTIIGVTQPPFHGTLIFGTPDFFMPIVNQEQVDGDDLLHARANVQGIFEILGRLKPGVTPAQAASDMNSIGAWMEKTYPKEVPHRDYTPAHPGLFVFGAPARAFLAGLMMLAGLILLAACANLGGLFAARASDRSREIALRLALGSSRHRILRQLLIEALVVAMVGGTVGLCGSILLLDRLSVWQPFPSAPVCIPVTPDAKIYVLALALALVSALLFAIIPIRQVLRSHPYEIVKAGSTGRPPSKLARWLTPRDLLLVVQIAICAVLVTSSLVAVRGLVRSLSSRFGFEPRNAMIVDVNLAQAGYKGDAALAMQKRMVEALQTIPGVQHAALVTNFPPLVYAAALDTHVFKEDTRDLRPINAAAHPYRYDVSPGYFAAAGTALLSGRDFTWHDDQNAPRVVLVNRTFAATVLGDPSGGVGRYFKLADGTLIQVIGLVEDGKYVSFTEDQAPAMFTPYLQAEPRATDMIVRSGRDSRQLIAAIRGQLHQLDPGLLVNIDTWNNYLGVAQFPSRVATVSLGVMGIMGAILSITGIFGMAAYSVSKRLRELGIRMALGARRTAVLDAALGRAVKLLAIGSLAGLILGLLATRVLASIVYQATPRDPIVLAGVVVSMALLGLIATWIPAQRALSLDPLILLREE